MNIVNARLGVFLLYMRYVRVCKCACRGGGGYEGCTEDSEL